MSGVVSLVVGAIFLAAEPAKPELVRYWRRSDNQLVLECKSSATPTKEGITVANRTQRPGETMTLTLHFDGKGRLVSAEAVQEKDKEKRTAALSFVSGTARIKRSGGITDQLSEVTPAAVVTTAPDWSDIFQLVRRYNHQRGGRQEFAGLWIHPSQPPRILVFRIEAVGKNTVKEKNRKKVLVRFRVRLRSGNYAVWADDQGRVYKFMVAGTPTSAVFREGVGEEAQRLGE